MIKEYTRPLEQGIDSDKNIFSVLEERVERTPDDNLVEYKNAQGEWAAFTAAEKSTCPCPKGISRYFPGTVSFRCIAKR